MGQRLAKCLWTKHDLLVAQVRPICSTSRMSASSLRGTIGRALEPWGCSSSTASGKSCVRALSQMMACGWSLPTSCCCVARAACYPAGFGVHVVLGQVCTSNPNPKCTAVDTCSRSQILHAVKCGCFCCGRCCLYHTASYTRH